MNYTNEIPVEFLNECFEYDPETGILTWKVRPLHHFDTCIYPLREVARFNSRYAGKPVGTPNRGYLQTRLHYNGKRYTTVNVHRICFAIATGLWPVETDHENAIHDDNKFLNLQDATRSKNQWYRFHRQEYKHPPKTKEQLAQAKEQAKQMHKLPRSEKQLAHSRQLARIRWSPKE
jgi:hypothetical protein